MIWLGLGGFPPEPEEVLHVLQVTEIVEELMQLGLMHQVPRELPLWTDQLPPPMRVPLSHGEAPKALTFRGSPLRVPIAEGEEIQCMSVYARYSETPERRTTEHRIELQAVLDEQPSLEERLTWLSRNSEMGVFNTFVPMKIISYNARGAANPRFCQRVR